MRRLCGVNKERTQMAKIRDLQMKDDTQKLICRTLHEHNGIVMQTLKEDVSKKIMFNHIKRLMRNQEQKDTRIKILNGSGITVNDEQEVVKEMERLWGNLFCTNGKVTLGQKKEMNGILNGADIPKEWKESRVKLLHKGGRTDELKNYRPIAILNITCKLCMLMVRERIDKWQKIVECWVKFKAVSEEGGVQKITCLC